MLVCGVAYGTVCCIVCAIICGPVCVMVFGMICCMVMVVVCYGMVWYGRSIKQEHAREGLVYWLDWPSPVEY